MSTSLPTELPKWYELDERQEKGWTPKANQVDIPEVREAWNGTIYPEAGKNFTVKLDRLQILSPIQVGGGSFPEGGILPAQIGGVPYIPGSSVRGSMLKYIRTIWSKIPTEEQQFWLTILEPDLKGWQPRKIRFESVLLKDLKAFPLYAQQQWQIFDQPSNKLSLQWQVSPKPPHPNPDRFRLQVLLKNPPKPAEKTWLEIRLKEMLEQRGIGRGTASGFGRLATSVPTGKWELHLTGMKPCVRSHIPKQNQTGEYRWSPQVLRATLRGYFIRFALDFLPRKQAELLTEKLFGGLGTLAKLRLTSYLYQVPRISAGDGYANIPAKTAHETWIINVDCNSEYHQLVGDLLNLASRLGGVGPGWRRPPHRLDRFGGFRGSEFTVTQLASDSGFTSDPASYLKQLSHGIDQQVRQLAKIWGVPPTKTPQPGRICSIWRGEADAWEGLVHGVCSTKAANRPVWCGSSNNRPSGYGVREHSGFCLVTVFDPNVERSLPNLEFRKIYG
jgi:hypothetical protein